MPVSPKILIAGATGYIGRHLVRAFLSQGNHVRCIARSPEKLGADQNPLMETVQLDLSETPTSPEAFKGIEIAYFLVHCMDSSGDFIEKEFQVARNFAAAAKEAGVKRIVYLGGLFQSKGQLSAHMKSRIEVGNILRSVGIPVVEFQASIIIGAGSLSFDLIRSLVNRLPVMITPKWVKAKAQPIHIDDVIYFLCAARNLKTDKHATFEIGGPDKVSYGDLMKLYGELKGLRRFMIQVPVLTPWLSSLWLALVTPLYARIGRRLIESIKHDSVLTTDKAAKAFNFHPKGIKEAMEHAIEMELCFIDQVADTGPEDKISKPLEAQDVGIIVEHRQIRTELGVDQLFRPVNSIGGKNGWYYAHFLWCIRGWIDQVLGGVGLARGRKSQDQIKKGDFLDWWIVEDFKENSLLRLKAQMRLPGKAWLIFKARKTEKGSILEQIAIFNPNGLLGIAYWYALYPLHYFIFKGMLKQIALRAKQHQPISENEKLSLESS